MATLLEGTSINVQGYTRAKGDELAATCNGNDIVCMQEIHLGQMSYKPTL